MPTVHQIHSHPKGHFTAALGRLVSYRAAGTCLECGSVNVVELAIRRHTSDGDRNGLIRWPHDWDKPLVLAECRCEITHCNTVTVEYLS